MPIGLVERVIKSYMESVIACDELLRISTHRFLLAGPSGLTLRVAVFLGDGDRDSDPEEAERGMIARSRVRYERDRT